MGRRYRPVSSSVSTRSGYSERSSSSQCDDVIQVLNRLVKHPDALTTDSQVAGDFARFRSLYSTLSEREQRKVNEHLQQNYCNRVTNPRPGTIAANLCGCLLKANAYGGQSAGCTATCAGTVVTGDTKECSDTVILWNNENGGPSMQILKHGGSTCRVYIDNDVNVSPQQKQEFLTAAGCVNAQFFNSRTNMPIGGGGGGYGNGNGGGNGYVAPCASSSTSPNVPVLPPVPEPETEGGFGWLWLLGLLFFIMIVIIIIYLYTRD